MRVSLLEGPPVGFRVEKREEEEEEEEETERDDIYSRIYVLLCPANGKLCLCSCVVPLKVKQCFTNRLS